jgi:internalin A
MVVQSDKQLSYLATNKDTNSLRALLFNGDLSEALNTINDKVPMEYTKHALDYILMNVTKTSKGLAWLKLPSDSCVHSDDSADNYLSAVTDSTVAHIQSMLSLRTLECMQCAKLTEIHINGLKQLQFLDLFGCDNLIELAVNGLVALQHMYLNMCSNLTTVQGLNKLISLRYLGLSSTQVVAALEGLSECTELQHLIMNYCKGFDDLPQLKTLENLEHLELRYCGELTTLSALKSLVCLQHLDLSCTGITSLDVTGLTTQLYLDLSSCNDLTTLTGIDTVTELQHLDMSGCVSLCSKLDLTLLVKLQLLDLDWCGLLTDVRGIDKLVLLRALPLKNCSKLSTALDLTELTSLIDVDLFNCTALPAVTGISNAILLTTLNLQGCDNLSFADVAVGSTMTALRTLEVSNGSILSFFQMRSLRLPALNALHITGSSSIITVDCSVWPSLTILIVENCAKLTTLHGLDKLQVLEKLHINQCTELEHISELACSKTLRSFKIKRCPKLCSIHNNLTDFEALIYLSVYESGIGEAIANVTNTILVEQVSALQQRPAFYYFRDYNGARHINESALLQSA